MSTKAEGQDKLEEYKVLPLKFNESDEDSTAHSIFIKKYRSDKKVSDKPIGKTLVALNIPPYATEGALRRVFGIAGQIENVTLIDSYENELKTKYQVKSDFFNEVRPCKFHIGFIVYKKSESVDIMLRSKALPPLSTEEHPVVTGVAKWTAEYNKRMVDIDKMQLEIDDYMKHYDKVKKAEEMKGEEGDDDGWITVGKKGHNAGFKQKESVVNKLEQKIQNQRKKVKSLTSFYSFELRESKKHQLVELRKKFEEDKLKMHTMRQNRKFRPY